MRDANHLNKTSRTHLTETDVLKITSIIESWPLPTITWKAVVMEVKDRLGRLYARQNLENKKDIKAAFQSKKSGQPKLLEINEAEQTIQRLRARNKDLEELIHQYDLRFLRHIENARLLRIAPKDLEKPLDGEPHA